MGKRTSIDIPERVGEAAEINYGGPADADFGPLARDLIPVRSMVEGDLRALVAIDRRITGRDRSAYFERKLEEALRESDVRISLVAELDGRPVGFIMARVDLGEFGRTDSAAIMDTIGVDPDYGKPRRRPCAAHAASGQPHDAAGRQGPHRSRLECPRALGFPRSLRLPPVVVSVLRSQY